jgi:hypothetical protein
MNQVQRARFQKYECNICGDSVQGLTYFILSDYPDADEQCDMLCDDCLVELRIRNIITQ